LVKLIEDNGIREIKPEKPHVRVEDYHAKNESFLTNTRFTCLPNVVMLYLKRNQAQNSLGSESIKIDALVQLDKDNLIAFTNHDVVYGDVNGVSCAVKMVPREKCFNRIGAAIIQLGGLEWGHYICEERTQSGLLIKHNDAIIESVSKESDFGTSGYFIRLDLVKKELL